MNQENHFWHIDLNCDLGEYENVTDGLADAAIMPFISSCNIACGAHAGNVKVMIQSVQWAKENQLRIGAHPGYPDPSNFGRLVMKISDTDLQASLLQQITMLKHICHQQGVRLAYVKPHGALYNLAARDVKLSHLIIQVMQAIDPQMALMGLAHSDMQVAAREAGIEFIAEAFVDRRYTEERQLLPRHQTGAVIEDFDEQAQQALSLVKGQDQAQKITSHSGKPLEISCQSLCLHGDTPGASETAQHLNHVLTEAGINIHA